MKDKENRIKLGIKQLKRQADSLYNLIVKEAVIDNLKPVVCNKCGYSWETTSKKLRVTCSNCNSTVFIKSKKEKIEEKEAFKELNKDYVQGKGLDVIDI